ncbi:MAG: V-type ATPase subunit [Peptostreptococcaceae bacterium]|jgi:V/A-type H+-transporting ATPase subunit C|nr:V-type ATPase subunit [Peptostreptococcaceae bacterium]
MSSLSKYCALKGKISAIKRKMLKLNDYNEIIAKDNISDILNFLKKNTLYEEVLKDFEKKEVHRGDFEFYLKKGYLYEIKKMMKFMSYKEKKFYKALFLRYEVEDLKIILRAVAKSEELSLVEQNLLKISYYSLDYKDLLSSKSVQELVSKLKHKPYYPYLRNLEGEDENRMEFHMEMNLETLYFRELVEKSKLLNTTDRYIILDMIGVNVDLINLQFIYRAIKYYNITPEEILNYTIPLGKYMRINKLKKLAYIKTVDEFFREIKSSKYNYIFKDDDLKIEINQLSFFEMFLTKVSKKNPFTIAQIIEFIHLLEFEVRDIISIIEGVRYEIDKKELKKFIIKKF